jgi:dipeptidyl aminopeptidase/acylaminoacyl peptidase
MTDLKELFEMTTKQIEPDLDSWREQEDRQRRRGRNRRIGAFAVAAAVVLIALVAFVVSRAGNEGDVEPAIGHTLGPTVPPGSLERDAQDVAIVDLQGQPHAGVPGIPDDAFALDLSRDRQMVVFVTSPGLHNQIATIFVDGTGIKVLPTDVEATMPAWSPSGDRIAFVGSYEGQDDVYVMDADGSNVRRITTDPADDIYPRWSPDGTTIAYTNTGDRPVDDAQYSPTADIWTIPVEGGTPVRLTTAPGADAHPDYSPDGSQIAYFHEGGAIWLMDADGTHRTRLLAVESGAFTPRWSPDGSLIAYTDYDDGYRPYVTVGDQAISAPLVMVGVVDPDTGADRAVGDVGMATDVNVPVWWSNDRLLIRRVGH